MVIKGIFITRHEQFEARKTVCFGVILWHIESKYFNVELEVYMLIGNVKSKEVHLWGNYINNIEEVQ